MFGGQCSQCTAYLDSSPRYTSKRSICFACTEKELEMWEKGTKVTLAVSRLASQNSGLECSLAFLRFQVDNEPTSGVLGGDVLIVVEGLTDQPIHAHKFVLASRSPVLCKMFDTNMVERETGILLIDDTTLPVMRAVVKFCYDAEVQFTDEVNSEAVLKVAHKYELDLLIKLCVQDLTETINQTNLPKRLKLARRFEAKGLEAAASSFFRRNFNAVIGDVLGEFC